MHNIFAYYTSNTKYLLLQKDLNEDDETWDYLSRERDPLVLSALLWEWLDSLKVSMIYTVD